MDLGLDGRVTAMLSRWAEAVEQFWTALDAEDGLGCYGPGYIHWGIQSNWNYSATMATLAAQPGVARSEHWRERALGALRFALATHVSDGQPLDARGMRAIALHEVGHALGMSHSLDERDVMAALVRVDGLSESDRGTIKLLYTLPAGHVR